MTNIVILRLANLKYSGRSIGNSIRIEIETPQTFFAVNKKISKGQEFCLNQDIIQFSTDENSFFLPIQIRIIERDPIFNDIGTLETTLKLDLSKSPMDRSVFKIEVVELKNAFQKNSAIFELSIDTVAAPTTRYISHHKNGWLMVKNEEDGSKISLPMTLRVQIERITSKREYFTIMEGFYKGMKASIKLRNDGTSYLTTENPQTDAIQLSYSISQKTLRLHDAVYLTKAHPAKPWKKGLYDIEIPDSPHQGGHHYPDVRFGISWFRVGHMGDRYIHTGRNSFGCITVIEQNRWDELYQILIRARKGDSTSIGTLRVVE